MIYFSASQATENNELDPVGIIRCFQSRMFLRRFAGTACFSFCPRHTDVSTYRTSCDDNCCDKNVSLFDRILRSRVLYFLPPPFSPFANRGRCLTSFATFRIRRGRGAKIESKMIFATPIPLNRVEVSLHRTSEAYPSVNVSQYAYGPYSAESRSQDKPLVISIGNGQEDGVER